MSRALNLLFAIFCYAIFFATFLYLVVFVGDFTVGSITPKTVDNPASTLTVGAAALIDVALIALFGLQHSVMARQGFKRAWTKIVPPQVERSMYVLLASLALIVLFRFWQPIDGIVWSVRNPLLHDLLLLLFLAGFGIVLVSTFLINHFELFGLQQAWFHARGRQAAAPELRQPLFYKWVAHPLYAGFFLAFWATPEMTAGHLLLAAGMSLYMLIAIRYEERDLTVLFGKSYTNYRASVGGLLPRFRSRA
jgi:protein-S-isoprenylcysteine O-methyltransferase Ste14